MVTFIKEKEGHGAEALSHSTMQNVTLIHRMRLFSPFHKKEIEPIKYPVDKYFSQKGTRRDGRESARA